MPKTPKKASKKPLTRRQLEAIDWAALLKQIGPLAAMFIKIIIDQLLAPQAKAGVACDDDCSDELKSACCEDLEVLAQYVASRLALHEMICGDECDDDESK